MTAEAFAHPAVRLSNATAEALLHTAMAAVIVILSVSAFAVSTVFGVAATFVITLLAAIALPAGIPFLIAGSFLFQNAVVAWYTPLIPDNVVFDAMRGANFVILITAFGAFLVASFQARVRGIAPLRPWLIGGILLCGVVTFYLGLGAVHGVPKDAIVYFRNTITPVACFYIAVVAASIYRVDLTRTVLWLAAAAVIYGYLELVFTMDFLSIFHGDLYIERDIWRQIQTGVWEKALHETGFVLRGLQDVMTTEFFNLPIFAGIVPRVFRIGGPNFHGISYAYALSVISVWLLFNKRWLLPLAALPLLLVIGSKGAMFMLLLALFVRIAAPLLGVRLTLLLTVLASVAWVLGSILFGIRSGDYHVLGLFAGIRDFLHTPLGMGLGFGGNLSSTSVNINWQLAQAEGAAGTPMESAIGVMLYQMGIGAFAFLAFLALLARAAWRAYKQTGHFAILYLFVTVTAISANAVLQEEAFFSPLALGLCLLLGGVGLGTHWAATGRRAQSASHDSHCPRQRILRSDGPYCRSGHLMVTLKEIAKAVGVSSATVSRVLNFDQTLSVTAKKRQAIIEAAEAMNYATPRARNRANSQGLNKVALVHFLRPDQELIDPYYVGLRLGIESRCQALKIETVKVYHTDLLPEATLLQSASGVIAIGRHDDAELAFLKRHARHVVFADFAPVNDEFDSVESDLLLATRKLLQALTQMGYRRIAFAGWIDIHNGVARSLPEKRCRAYMEWMTQAGLFDERLCLTGQNTEESGYRLTRQIMAEPNPPDALITCNDNMAVGAYRAIHQLGLRIPEDIAVASFNDISVAQFLNPPLTTVRLPSEEIGETAVELLLERIAGRELAKRITLASQIIWRGSSRHPSAL